MIKEEISETRHQSITFFHGERQETSVIDRHGLGLLIFTVRVWLHGEYEPYGTLYEEN